MRPAFDDLSQCIAGTATPVFARQYGNRCNTTFQFQQRIIGGMDEDILSARHIHHLKMLIEMRVVSDNDPVFSLGYTGNPCVVVFPGELDTISKKTALIKNLTGCSFGIIGSP